MLSTNTPFKIHDENQGLNVLKSSSKHINIHNHKSDDFTPLKPSQSTSKATKSTRKALVDLSNSQVNTRTPGLNNPKNSISIYNENNTNKTINKTVKSKSIVQFTDEIHSNIKSSTKNVSVIKSTGNSKSTPIDEFLPDYDEMICTRKSVYTDPHDIVMEEVNRHKRQPLIPIEIKHNDSRNSIDKFDDSSLQLLEIEDLLLEDKYEFNLPNLPTYDITDLF